MNDIETLIPTSQLRFVNRLVPYHSGRIDGSPTQTTARVLQQLFMTTGGQPKWIDVPCVDEATQQAKGEA